MPCVVFWRPEALDYRAIIPQDAWNWLRRCLPAILKTWLALGDKDGCKTSPCPHARLPACMDSCLDVWMLTFVCLHSCLHVCTCVGTHVCMSASACVCLRPHVCTRMRLHVCVYVPVLASRCLYFGRHTHDLLSRQP